MRSINKLSLKLTDDKSLVNSNCQKYSHIDTKDRINKIHKVYSNGKIKNIFRNSRSEISIDRKNDLFSDIHRSYLNSPRKL
jgi:hypothetical protein